MTSKTELPSYEALNFSLEQAHAHMNSAEVHGMVCGYICAGSEMDGKSWIEPILSGFKASDKLLQDIRQLLLQLYQASNYQLQSVEFDFELLLPDDDAELNIRAEALSHWCQGFIIAMEQSGICVETRVSFDAREALQNMMEISKLDYEHIDVTEEDERAYNEVMEYVRVAVLMIHTEITHVQGKEGRDPSGKHLH